MQQAQTHEQQRKVLFSRIAEATDGWFKKACQNPAVELFLFYKPGALEVSISEQSPGDGWERATEAPVSCAMTKEQVRQWSFEKLYAHPVYPH